VNRIETTRHKLTRDIGFYQSLCAKMQQLKWDTRYNVQYELRCGRAIVKAAINTDKSASLIIILAIT
jgi:hypothetical protein